MVTVVKRILPLNQATKIVKFFNRRAHRGSGYNFDITMLSSMTEEQSRLIIQKVDSGIPFEDLCLMIVTRDTKK